MPALDFSVRHACSPLSVGIEVSIILSSSAKHEARLRRNVLGRSGWLQQLRVAIVELRLGALSIEVRRLIGESGQR